MMWGECKRICLLTNHTFLMWERETEKDRETKRNQNWKSQRKILELASDVLPFGSPTGDSECTNAFRWAGPFVRQSPSMLIHYLKAYKMTTEGRYFLPQSSHHSKLIIINATLFTKIFKTFHTSFWKKKNQRSLNGLLSWLTYSIISMEDL